MASNDHPAAHTASRLRQMLLWAIPRTLWTVVERDGRAEFVIWRQWRGRAYDINSVVSLPGRYDRQTDFGLLDLYQNRHRYERCLNPPCTTSSRCENC